MAIRGPTRYTISGRVVKVVDHNSVSRQDW